MSVSSILTDLESQVATTLGASWSELDYVYDLESNSAKSIDFKYGIGAGEGFNVSGTTKAITVDFSFFVILTKAFKNRSDDTKQRTVLSEIYDQFESININVFQKKLGNSAVLLVSDLSYSEPEVIHEGIGVRVDFVIKFRNATT